MWGRSPSGGRGSRPADACAARRWSSFSVGIDGGKAMIRFPFPNRANLCVRSFAVALFATVLVGCGEGQRASAPPPPTVTVATPSKRTIVDQDEYVGRFVAINVVEVRARVSGYLDQVHFEDE